MIKIKIYFYTSIILLSLTSCLNSVASEVKNWIEISNIEDIKGHYHFLSDDGIKIFLPQSFKKYSSVGYQQLLDSLATKKNYDLEIKRLHVLREMEGNFYIFFDEETRSTYTINTLPYTPLYRGDAQYILGIISMNHKKIASKTDLEFTKITAKYNSNKTTQIFKAIHRIDDTKKSLSTYNSSYILTSNKKTVFLQLHTGFDVDFDPFLQKMIL
ncbi:hypothetical protein [uncultured Algibacter sp.]|uniref:hypothetical protein n=1 Tax=uncultured Algibacter sp. TaxID=298659 RepID=UPI00260AEA9A|nr:hypothetical protein [uncultured Algibacter sp.]